MNGWSRNTRCCDRSRRHRLIGPTPHSAEAPSGDRRSEECRSPSEAIKHAVDPDAWESSYKFAFVRHPAERALSLYPFAAMKEEERRQPHIRNLWYSTPPGKKDDPDSWPAIVAFRESDSFSGGGFIRHPALSAAVGMQPQSEFLCDSDGRLLVDVVGKFERLNEDRAPSGSHSGCPTAPCPVSTPHDPPLEGTVRSRSTTAGF